MPPVPLVSSNSPSWALLSVLGVPGWGPLHLLIKQRSDPAQIAGRLRQSLRKAGLPPDADDVSGGRLLSALLRSQSDLDPVAAIAALSTTVPIRYRHRLVCREAGGLKMRSWERGACAGGWCSLGPGQRLQEFLQAPQGQAWKAFAGCRACQPKEVELRQW